MYPYLTNDLLDTLWTRAWSAVPDEAIGLLVGTIEPLDQTCLIFEKELPLVNEAQDPTKNFCLYTEQVKRIQVHRSRGDLLCLWHSHVKAQPTLSQEDQGVMWEIKLPMLVVALDYKVAVMFSYLAPNPHGKQPIVEFGRWRKP